MLHAARFFARFFARLSAHLAACLLLAGLSGCADWPEASRRAAPLDTAWPDLPSGPYYFAWHLSGDRAVGPLQVFDNGRDTWLQFAPEQALPALFGVRDGVEYLLPYQRRGPYVHVTGVWPRLLLRGGALLARADYRGAALSTENTKPPGTAPESGHDAEPPTAGAP